MATPPTVAAFVSRQWISLSSFVAPPVAQRALKAKAVLASAGSASPETTWRASSGVSVAHLSPEAAGSGTSGGHIRHKQLEVGHAFGYVGTVPIYEFHCADCNRDSEVLTPTTKWEGTACPHCGSTRLAKRFSVFAATSGGSDAAPVCGGDPKACDMCCPARPCSA